MASEEIYEGEGEGWLVFASIILLIIGFFNVVLGVTLVAKDEIYLTGPEESVVLLANVTTWGWVMLVVGVLEILAGFGVITRNQLARWFAIVLAAVGAIAHLPVFFGPQPLFSFIVVLMCVLVIYGLAVYGGHEVEA